MGSSDGVSWGKGGGIEGSVAARAEVVGARHAGLVAADAAANVHIIASVAATAALAAVVVVVTTTITIDTIVVAAI